LTGAGFGGCIVALVTSGDADMLKDALNRRFYRKIPAHPHELFIAKPSDGARVDALSPGDA
jgi:galactokinase